ncbi:hypothetical protein EI94DRAFT_887306 [Lactarius quietus]|nr:hypothetical protein EI94DRAFT_1268167 [Lactarius quietus]KAF8260599.1 hypothetical protein EI94DRAFT_887306 [Lactarius quietus]
MRIVRLVRNLARRFYGRLIRPIVYEGSCVTSPYLFNCRGTATVHWYRTVVPLSHSPLGERRKASHDLTKEEGRRTMLEVSISKILRFSNKKRVRAVPAVSKAQRFVDLYMASLNASLQLTPYLIPKLFVSMRRIWAQCVNPSQPNRGAFRRVLRSPASHSGTAPNGKRQIDSHTEQRSRTSSAISMGFLVGMGGTSFKSCPHVRSENAFNGTTELQCCAARFRR